MSKVIRKKIKIDKEKSIDCKKKFYIQKESENTQKNQESLFKQ